jgi:phenylacetate-coenzyme A ligase PaaK-like adenylate-forming protein
VFTYEYPTELACRQVREVFKRVPLVSSYGTTETGYVFMQCEEGKLHQNADSCRVDYQPLRKEHGGPFLGRILVTPFKNPWSYLIRFDTGDIVRLEESATCPCGRTSGLILSSLAGRTVNLTLTCSGRLVTLLELDGVISRLNGIVMYKMIQTTPRSYEFHVVSRRRDTAALAVEALALLRELYGQEALIDVLQESDIAPSISGKYLASQALFPIDLDHYLDRPSPSARPA